MEGEHSEGEELKCSVFKKLGQGERGAREQQSEVQEKGAEALWRSESAGGQIESGHQNIWQAEKSTEGVEQTLQAI